MFRTLILGAASALALLLALGGCAAMNNLNNEVSTYGPWPGERKPASYAFERLPSQQAHPEHQQLLEDAARGAVEGAGFVSTPDLKNAEYLMQLGARVTTDGPWYDYDPIFWHGGTRPGFGRFGPGFGYGRWGRGSWGFGAGAGFDHSNSFDREVALLIRDGKTGKLLYEARASNSGPSASIDRLLAPMFRAAMANFPGVDQNPRTVTVPLSMR
jgi:hypothetical protein